MVGGKFVKLENGNYVNTSYIFSVYAIQSGGTWRVDLAGGTDGLVTIGTLATPVFTTEEKAQQFIQQVFGGFDPNSLVDL